MPELKKAKEPFKFFTRQNLSELTGLRASNLKQLLSLLKKVPGSSIYHHTHQFLQQHQYLSPEPPNDFAYWVTEILGDDDLGEKLSSIDTMKFSKINDLRNKIIDTISNYLKDNPSAKLRFAKAGAEFYFLKSISFILSTSFIASDLQEFMNILHKITIDSIYFHIFETRLRLKKNTNDFSLWIEHSIGDQELSHEITKLDPYTCSLENLRHILIKLIKNKIK